MPFEKQLIRHELNANVQNPVFRQAWEKGEIDENTFKIAWKINC
jgi:hypothetical protein